MILFSTIIIVLRTISYRLYPSSAQASRLSHYLYVGRKLYNDGLVQRIAYYQDTGKGLSYFTQTKDLTILRSVSLVLADVPLAIERDALDRLDKAFANFFRRVKEGKEKPGFPRFKSFRRWHSFGLFIQGSGKTIIKGNRIHVSGVNGGIPFRGGQSVITGKIKVQRILIRAGKWFCQLVVDDLQTPPPLIPIQSAIGIDLGLTSFATFSSGEKIDNPRFYRALEKKLARADRAVSRKVKGSANRRKAINRLQRVHEKIRNHRLNFTHHLSKRIVQEHQLIAVEKLNINGMMQSRFGKSILDAAWGQFLFQLSYKAESAGCSLCAVNPRGTSQECSKCGEVILKNLTQRVHSCYHCGLILDRDENAALNILQRALKEPGPVGAVASCGAVTEPC